MKLNRATLPVNKPQKYSEDLDFSKQVFDDNHVRKIVTCHAEITATEFGDILQCNIQGNAHVIASCSYTLEDVPLDVSFKEDFYFSDEKDESQDTYYEPNNEVDLDPYILALVLAEVPHNITKSGASLPKSGNGYRVLSEEDYLKEKNSRKNSAFNILDTLENEEK